MLARPARRPHRLRPRSADDRRAARGDQAAGSRSSRERRSARASSTSASRRPPDTRARGRRRRGRVVPSPRRSTNAATRTSCSRPATRSSRSSPARRRTPTVDWTRGHRVPHGRVRRGSRPTTPRASSATCANASPTGCRCTAFHFLDGTRRSRGGGAPLRRAAPRRIRSTSAARASARTATSRSTTRPSPTSTTRTTSRSSRSTTRAAASRSAKATSRRSTLSPRTRSPSPSPRCSAAARPRRSCPRPGRPRPCGRRWSRTGLDRVPGVDPPHPTARDPLPRPRISRAPRRRERVVAELPSASIFHALVATIAIHSRRVPASGARSRSRAGPCAPNRCGPSAPPTPPGGRAR